MTAVRRWNKVTDIPLGRRAERILRTLGWEMMSDFEHLSEAQLAGPDYLEAILKIIEMKAGVREDDDRRAAFRGVLHENAKRKDETLGQYANRRLRDFAKASSYGVQLPEEFRAALLREGAGLSEQGQQNLTTLLQGYDHDVDRMALTLSRMDGRPDRLSGFTCEAPGPESYLADPEEEPVDGDEGDTAGEGSDSTDDQAILEELSDMNFSSEQASLVFALLENRPPRLRRTWKENKKFKAELRKDRQSFTKGAPGEGRSELSRGPPRGSNTRPKVSREQLKKISRCHLCGRRGHWAEDCRQAQSSGKTGNGEAPGRPSGFCYLGTSARGGSHFSFMTYVTPASTSTAASTWSFLTIPSGMAILDIGATQDIVGKTAFRALEHELDRCGLKALEIPTTAPAPTGIGGAAQVSKTALVPISPGGVPGVIQFLVIDGEVPPLLSVGLLEHLGANMDLTTNEVRLKNIDVNLKMVSLPSGHRAIQLVEWTGGDFPVPQMARDQYGLSEGAFSKDAKSSSAYIKQEQCDRAGDWEQQPTSQDSLRESSACSPCLSDSHVCDQCAELSHAPHDHQEVPPIESPLNARVSVDSGSTDPMGNCSTRRRTQFDFPAVRLEHGGSISTDGGGGRPGARPSRMEVAPPDPADVLPPRDHQGKLCALGIRRDASEKHFVRAKEVPDRRCPGAHEVLTSGSPDPSGESIRLLDSVPQVRGSVVLCAPSGTSSRQSQGAKYPSSCILKRQPSGAKQHRVSFYDDSILAKGSRGTTPRDDPGGTQCYLAGDGLELPRSGGVPSGSRTRTRTDAYDDAAAEHASGDRRDDSAAGLRSGGEKHRSRDDRGERDPPELVTRQQPEPLRPAVRTWPKWATWQVLSLSSSLLSWGQLSHGAQGALGNFGGGSSSWMVYCPLPEPQNVPRLPVPPGPAETRWPWIGVVQGREVPSKTKTVWHEVRREGQLYARGPGPPGEINQGDQLTQWTCPRKFQLLQECLEPGTLCVGFNEDGEESSKGPFWLVSAPRLEHTLDEDQPDEGNLETRHAEDNLIRLAREQQRESSGSSVDIVELFQAGATTTWALKEGMRVPARHEDFTSRSGWRVQDKEHRRRFRRYLRDRRPGMVAMTVPTSTTTSPSGTRPQATCTQTRSSSTRSRATCTQTRSSSTRSRATCTQTRSPEGKEQDSLVSHRKEVIRCLESSFSMEVVKEQKEGGRHFYLVADVDDRVWSDPDWVEMSQDPEVISRVSTDGRRRVATNSRWASLDEGLLPEQLEDETPCWALNWDHLSEGEKLAYHLRLQRDFSTAACVKLLELTKWPHQRRRRKSVCDPNVYQVLGQYSYGKFSGITLSTYKLRNTTLYLNDWMTAHGATGPRSSLSITENAQVRPHKDVNNIGLNYSIAIGSFKGGDLWVEDENGDVPLQVRPGESRIGRIYKHRDRMNVFNPKKFHSVDKWNGQRWSLTAFRSRSSEHMSSDSKQHLENFGFSLEGYSEHPLLRDGTARSLSLAAKWESTGVLPSASYVSQTTAADIDEEEELDGGEGIQEQEGHPNDNEEPEPPPAQITESQKRLVHQVHVNTGHPPKERFLRTMRAAGALPHVLRYIRDDYHCEACQAKRGPDHRRKAQCPRVHGFNRVLSMDVFYLKYRNESVPVLNIVCHGTGFQMAQRIVGCGARTPTSEATWKTFAASWIRFMGPPSLIITDGGLEFSGRFERGVEQLGVLHHITAPESPWQNSRAERHGGWLKQRLAQELDSGQGVVESVTDLDELLAVVMAAKNRWFNSGGYTPVQLVFGEVPRVPGELLSENFGGQQVISDGFYDPAGMDEAGNEFRKSARIRERGRQLALAETSRETVRRALATSSTPLRTWSPGQWVYCFRRGRVGDQLHPTSRWVGPGLVVLQTRSVVFVAMRSRLWRCSPEQLRPAFPSEVLGRRLATDPGLAELLRRVMSGSSAGAVDVAREGPPPAEGEQVAPTHSEPSGESIPVETENPVSSDVNAQRAPQEAPREVPPLPAGLTPFGLHPSTNVENEPPAPPVLPRQTSGSRRSSVQEPAQEPESSAPAETAPHEQSAGILDLDCEGPSTKQRRVGEPSETRTPGTPIHRLLGAVQRGREVGAERSDSSRSRSPIREEDAQLYQVENYWSLETDGTLSLVASRSDEVDIRAMNAADRALFDESDKIEWKAVLDTGAVRVVTGREAREIRLRHPERILDSRLVRRRKPQPGVGCWKAKSRWCLAGHTDPDTATLTTYSPTPSTEGLMAFCQTGLNLNHVFSFSDVKNAFCQSRKLRRPNGPLYAKPCDGLGLEKDDLIVIDVPVYGLDDAPAEWRATVVEFLLEQGFTRNLVEPCWWMRFDEQGKNEAQVLIEVDDFIVSTAPHVREKVKADFQARFKFGKWDNDEAEYAGRMVRVLPDRILIDQKKYIEEQIHPVLLAKGRRSEKDSPLQDEEFEAFRSAIYKVNWIAKESRPEVCGMASILASKLKNATVEDVTILNKNINFLRSTSSRALTLWKVPPEEAAFVVVSDAGGVGSKHDAEDELGLPADSTQGAWMVFLAEALPVGSGKVRASPLAWRSSKLKRKVFSTFGGETQAMLQGISEADWLQVMIRDATYHDVELREWRNCLSPHMLIMKGDARLPNRQDQCSVTDAKSLYDCLLKEHPQGKQDRRSSLELAIIVRDLQETRSMVRWVPHQKMVVDPLTKSDPMRSNGALDQFLRSGMLSLVDVQDELRYRASDPRHKSRSHAASVSRLLREYETQGATFWSTLIRGCCDSDAVVCAGLS